MYNHVKMAKQVGYLFDNYWYLYRCM